MNKDNTGRKNMGGKHGQLFTQGERVMVRRLGDGNEYRATIAGVSAANDGHKVMIVEMSDTWKVDDYPYSHATVTEVCIDKEIW